MTTTEDWTPVENLANDPATLADLDRQVICRAIRMVARATGGIFTANQARDARECKVNPHMVGAVMNSLAQSGAIVDTGRTAPSGDRANRNSRRRLPVWSAPNVEAVR